MKLFFLKTALLLSQESKCVSYKVGCLIVKDKRILSTGYNGTAPGFPNCNTIFRKETFDREKHHAFSDKYEIHAEMNAILFAAKNDLSIDGCELYTTVHPCDQCLKNLIQSGIKKIYYVFDYDKATINNELLGFIEIEKVESEELNEFIKVNNLKFNNL
jgi:dCMP deaminase